jgi:drug/metabolite transporter (DMT)-like permease
LSWTALGAVIFWGFSFIATKVALKEVHPLTLLTLRYAIGALLLLLAQYGRDRVFLRTFLYRDWIHIFLLAAVGVSGLGLLQSYGLLYTTAINTGWIIAINPIFITLAARLFLGEAITLRKISGILLGFFGIFLIISKGVFSFSLFRSTSTFGDLLVLASAVAWTSFTVGGKGFISRFTPYSVKPPSSPASLRGAGRAEQGCRGASKYLPQRKPRVLTRGAGFTPLSAVTAIMISGFLIILPLNILAGEWSKLLHWSLSTWMSIFFLGIFCSGLAYLFWYSALEKIDSSIVGMYLYLEPFVTLIGAYLFLGEGIHWITLTGGGMTLVGVYLATWKISSPSPQSPPTRGGDLGGRLKS